MHMLAGLIVPQYSFLIEWTLVSHFSPVSATDSCLGWSPWSFRVKQSLFFPVWLPGRVVPYTPTLKGCQCGWVVDAGPVLWSKRTLCQVHYGRCPFWIPKQQQCLLSRMTPKRVVVGDRDWGKAGSSTVANSVCTNGSPARPTNHRRRPLMKPF